MIDSKKEEIQRKKDSIIHVMKDYRGREFVWEVLSQCRIYDDINGEGAELFRLLGARKLGLDILSAITEADEDAVLQMTLEAKERGKNHEHRIAIDRANLKSRKSEYGDVKLDDRHVYGDGDDSTTGKHDGLTGVDFTNIIGL